MQTHPARALLSRLNMHPAAWTVAELGDEATLAVQLNVRHREALLAAVTAAPAVETEALTPADFPLPGIATDVADWIDTVRHGRGLLLLRGLPVESLSVDEACRLFYGLGSHFGIAVSQSNMGEKIGHVVNVGGQDPRQRAYRNARSLNLHTDRCDYVGMLCLRPAMRGGISGYASALAVLREIEATAPDLLDPLLRGFKLHRFGEQRHGEPLTAEPVPVVSAVDGRPNVVYIRGYIDLAVQEGHYALTPLEQRALDTFDAIANRADMRLDLRLEPGEATFTNNSILLHRRDAFEDDPDPAKQRHLLRLWLMDPDLPAVPAVRAHKSLAGIGRIEGRGTYYAGTGPARP